MPRDIGRVAVVSLVIWATNSQGWEPAAYGQGPTPPAPRAAAIATNSNSSAAVQSRSGGVTGRLDLDTGSTTVAPRAVVRVEGTVAPGLRVVLDGSASTGGKNWFRWLQTTGARVTLKGSDQAVASFLVPQEATSLGFVLVVGNGVGVDAHAVTVAAQESEPVADLAPLQANAGGNQTGVVGRRVVLDGSRSEPQGRVRYRWMQLDGPRATIQTAGSTCSFVPEGSGSYRFALLVVGADDLVSEASLATVRVRSAVEATDAGAADRSAMALDEFSRVAILGVPGGSKLAPGLARSLDLVADKIETQRTFDTVALDLIDRFNGVVPPAQRASREWLNDFFQPWMAQVADRMRLEGIDLTKPAERTRPLTKIQRARLADQFRLTAAGLRSSTLGR